MANDLSPTVYLSETAGTARASEVSEDSFTNGCNLAGSNACGIGIGVEGGAVVNQPQQFTLIDQKGDARTPQASQHIGGVGYTGTEAYPSSGGDEGFNGSTPIAAVEPAADGKGGETVLGAAELASATEGWVVEG